MHLMATPSEYHVLNFIAINLQLYKIFKIMQVSFFGTPCIINKTVWYIIGLVYSRLLFLLLHINFNIIYSRLRWFGQTECKEDAVWDDDEGNRECTKSC